MQGAVGYDRSGKKLDAEVMKKYIYGGHVAEYMEEMEEEEPEKYSKHFANFIEEDISGGDLEDLFTEVWSAAAGNGAAAASPQGRQPVAWEMGCRSPPGRRHSGYTTARRVTWPAWGCPAWSWKARFGWLGGAGASRGEHAGGGAGHAGAASVALRALPLPQAPVPLPRCGQARP